MLFGSVWYCLVVFLTMPHIFTHAEYADIFVYRFYNGNALLHVENTVYGFLTAEYLIQECLLVFTTNCIRLVHFPAVIFLLNMQTNKMWMK